MHRVVIYGSGGSGKSTVAARLAKGLGVPHVEIDTLAYDGAGRYDHVAHAVLAERFAAATAGPGWVVEGMHRDQLSQALVTADTFVWLDPPAWRVAAQLAGRTLRLLVTRQERHGARLTLTALRSTELPFVVKTLRKMRRRRHYAEGLAALAERHGAEVLRVRTRRQAHALVVSARRQR